MQQPQALQREAKIARAPAGVVPALVRIVEAHPERDRIRAARELANLREPPDDRRRTVGQDETRPQAGGVLQNRHHVFDDEGFSTGEGELPDPEVNGSIHQGPHVGERNALQAGIPGPRTFEAERTIEVAGSTRVKPELVQRMRRNPAGLARGRVRVCSAP